jgi:probable phosphoglycerate mutase
MGIFQGLTAQESDERFPHERAAYSEYKDTYVIPGGGESAEQRSTRALACLEDLAKRNPDQTIVVVTHGGLLVGIVERTLGLPPGTGRRFSRLNATLNIFTRRPHGWILETWGDATHLDHTATPKYKPQL